jgi:nucleotide-binding universal stress UspA family protein
MGAPRPWTAPVVLLEVVVSTSPAEQSSGRVVVGVDGSPSSEHALRWAAAQSRLTGQPLHAIITWQLPVSYDGWIVPDVDWGGDAAGTLQKSVENVLSAAEGARVVQHVMRGHPAKVLVDETGDAADLLVVGSRGHGSFAGLVLGSVSQHVVAHAACPVAVVRGDDDRHPAGGIVVGVDGSPESKGALRWAAREAEAAGRPLHAVLVGELSLAYGLVDRAEPDWAAHAEHTLSAAVDDALGAEAATVHREVLEGPPSEMLLRRATDADLLVLGSRGRGGFTGLLLGSVSQHAAAHAPCPVVVHHG